MLKLLVMLGAFLMVALALLGLRQHRLELQSQGVAIFDAITDRRDTLLNQRVQIAKPTNPQALAVALKSAGSDTGEAMRTRETQLGPRTSTPTVPTIETDLVAPLLNDGGGHANPARPRASGGAPSAP